MKTFSWWIQSNKINLGIRVQRKLKNGHRKKVRKKIKEGTPKIYLFKFCFVNKTNQKSWATSNTYNSNFNANISQWGEKSSSEEVDIRMHKCRGVINVEITSEEVRGKSSEVEEIKIT